VVPSDKSKETTGEVDDDGEEDDYYPELFSAAWNGRAEEVRLFFFYYTRV